MTTVKEILISALTEMGADGLCAARGEDPCGCGLDDFRPCEGTYDGGVSLSRCVPATYNEFDDVFEPMTDEEIQEFAATKLDHDMQIPEGDSGQDHTVSRI